MDVLLPDQTNPTLNLGTVTPEDDGRKFKLVVSNGILPNLTKTVTIKVHTWHPDAAAYLTAVETADGQALEPAIAAAWDVFFRQMDDPAHPTPTAATHKIALAEGTMIPMLGARTLAGALIPAYPGMPMPTNVGFVTGDYDRAVGLKGDGAGKHLDSNTTQTYQDDFSIAVYRTDVSGDAGAQIGIGIDNSTGCSRIRSSNDFLRISVTTSVQATPLSRFAEGLAGGSRHSPEGFYYFTANALSYAEAASQSPQSGNILIFARGGIHPNFCPDRMTFGLIGRSIDLEYMDSCLTTLQSSIAAALA